MLFRAKSHTNRNRQQLTEFRGIEQARIIESNHMALLISAEQINIGIELRNYLLESHHGQTGIRRSNRNRHQP